MCFFACVVNSCTTVVVCSSCLCFVNTADLCKKSFYSLLIYQKWLIWRRHQAQGSRDKPQSKFHQSHSPAQTRFFRTTPPLWNLTTAGYPKLIALCLCNKLTPTLTEAPLKKIAGSMGAGLLPPRALISVWQSSCPVPMRDWPFLWRIRDERPEDSPFPYE